MSIYNITGFFDSVVNYALNYKAENIDPLSEKLDCCPSHQRNLLITSIAASAILFFGGVVNAFTAPKDYKKIAGLAFSALAGISLYYQYVALNNIACP